MGQWLGLGVLTASDLGFDSLSGTEDPASCEFRPKEKKSMTQAGDVVWEVDHEEDGDAGGQTET